MLSFSIPADFQVSTMEQIGKRNAKWDIPIKEVYGSLNPSIFGTGRSSSVLRQIKFDTLKKYVAACEQNGVKFNYALNFNCTSNMEFTDKGKKEVVKFLRKLGSIGVERFTAVLPSIMELLNFAVPDAKVSVSVISNVDSYGRLKAFLASKNVDRVMLPEYLNRRMSKLEKVTSYGKNLGVEFGTIVNGLCLIDCPFRDFHYSFNSHAMGGKNFQPADYYVSICTLRKLENPTEVLKMGWIRPEDLKHYVSADVNVFKIAGREMYKPDFLRVVDIYNEGSFEGNLWELFRCFSQTPPNEKLNYSKMFNMPNSEEMSQFTRRFFEAKSFCTTKECETCNYCNTNSNLIHANNFNDWKEILEKEKLLINFNQ